MFDPRSVHKVWK